MKKTLLILAALVLALLTPVANAQTYAAAWYGGAPPTSGCGAGTTGFDLTNGRMYTCRAGVWYPDALLLGAYQGTTATAIADGTATVLTGPSIKIPAVTGNVAGRHFRVTYKGVYTNAAASLLNVDVALCTISGCASGTVVVPAGCLVTSTNQANNLTNGQFTAVCDFTVAATGTSGTLMAKSTAGFNLGAATTAVQSIFADTATAVSAAVNLTVDEFVHPRFKFTTGNAGNSVTLQQATVESL
jgi:hypothetical protein